MANASVLEQGAAAASETFDELFHNELYRCAKNSYVYIATDVHPSVIECYANAVSECEWTEMRRQNPTIDECCKTRASRRIDPLVFDKKRTNLVQTLDLLGKLQEHKVFGILVCDIRVPDELKDYFCDFAPIIKHANINYEDIGDYMQNVADRMGIKVKNRRCVIDSYFAKGIALTDEYLVWLLNEGLVVDRV